MFTEAEIVPGQYISEYHGKYITSEGYQHINMGVLFISSQRMGQSTVLMLGKVTEYVRA